MAWSFEHEQKVTKPAARSCIGQTMLKLGIDVKGRSDRGDGKYYELPDRVVLVQQFARMLDIPEESLEQ